MGLLGAWTVNNGVRYDDYALARGAGAFFPFYRAFGTDRIVSPENGEGVARARRRGSNGALDEEPYRSYGITLERFFEGRSPARVRGRRRDHGSPLGLADGLHADARGVDRGGRAHPRRYARGVAGTVLDELWSPLQHRVFSARRSSAPTPARRRPQAPIGRARSTGFHVRPRESEIPSARQGFFSTTPDGSLTEVWTSPTDHSLDSSRPRSAGRFEEFEAESGRLDARASVPGRKSPG